MPVIRDTAFPLTNYAEGTYTLPSSVVPSAARAVSFSIARCTSATPTIWPSASVKISVSLEVSIDNGATWRFLSGYTAEGGIVGKNGVEAPKSSFYVDLPSGVNRRLRGSLTITGGTLRSQAFVDVVTE